MRLIARGLIRGLLTIRWRAISLVLIVASGVSIFFGIALGMEDVVNTQSGLLDAAHFADLDVEILPEDTRNLPDLTALPDVEKTAQRLVSPGVIDLPDGTPLAALLLLQTEAEPTVNGFRLLAGRAYRPGQGEVVVDKALADFHGYRIGDKLVVHLGEKRMEETVVGIVLSPEFLITTASPDYVIAQPGSLGVIWGDLGELSDGLGFAAVNDLLFRYAPGADHALAAQAILHAMAGLNIEKITPRDESYGVKMVGMNFKSFRIYTPVIVVTLLVSSLLMGITTFRRWVVERRRQFAVLLALGYRRIRIAAALAWIGLLVGMVGGVVGIGIGLWLARGFSESYAAAMHMPFVTHGFDATLALETLLLGAPSGLGAILAASLPTLRLSPRELLTGPSVRIDAQWGLRLPAASTSLLYAARSLWRQRWLTAAAVLTMGGALGVAVSYGLAMSSTFFTIADGFRGEDWTYAVDFQYPLYFDEASRLFTDVGATRAEPYLRTSVGIRRGNAYALAQLVGIMPGGALHRQGVAQGRAVAEPGEVVISHDVARDLGVGLGGDVVLEKGSERLMARVVGITDDIYLETVSAGVADAEKLAQTDGQITGAYLDAPPAAAAALLRDSREVARVTGRDRLVDFCLREMREKMGIVYITIVFSVAVSILFVTTLVHLAVLEKSGEYAVLRSLGFSARRLRRIVFYGAAIQVVAALLLAAPFGCLLAGVLNARLAEAWLMVHFHASIGDFLWPALASLVVAPLVAFRGARAILRLDIPDHLRARTL
jgi:putative ABC transport system permease protein